MRIKWLGHSCFKISSEKGIRIVTDPFDSNVGYNLPAVETDIVTISHNHYDHNFIDCLNGDFEVVSKVGNFYIKDISITGVHTYHDEVEGDKRGSNIVYIFDIDGMKVCHMGDIGHVLTEKQIEMIGHVDILMIPVGGVYTVDYNDAKTIVEQLNPSIVIPMHYKTQALKFKLDAVDDFIKQFDNINMIPSRVIKITKEDLKPGGKEIYVLKYE